LFKAFHVQSLKTNAEHDQRVLETQLKSLDNQIATKSTELESFQQAHDIVSSDVSEELLLRQSQGLQRELDMTVVDIKSVRQRSGMPENATAEMGARHDEIMAIPNPEATRLKKLEARKAALIEQMENLQRTTRGSIGKITTYQRLRGEKKTFEDLRVIVERNLIETRLQKEFPTVDIVQTQVARAPKNPAFPIFTLNAIVALLFGFVAGCYNALLLEYLKRLKLDRIRANLDETPLREASL